MGKRIPSRARDVGKGQRTYVHISIIMLCTFPGPLGADERRHSMHIIIRPVKWSRLFFSISSSFQLRCELYEEYHIGGDGANHLSKHKSEKMREKKTRDECLVMVEK